MLLTKEPASSSSYRLDVPADALLHVAENMMQPCRRGTVSLVLPSKIKTAAIITGAAALSIKLVSVAVDRLHERRQNRQLKKLNRQVDELEERVRKLEKA